MATLNYPDDKSDRPLTLTVIVELPADNDVLDCVKEILDQARSYGTIQKAILTKMPSELDVSDWM